MRDHYKDVEVKAFIVTWTECNVTHESIAFSQSRQTLKVEYAKRFPDHMIRDIESLQAYDVVQIA